MNVEEVRAELSKLFEHSVQLRAETMKLQRESWVRPFVAGAISMALGTALAALVVLALTSQVANAAPPKKAEDPIKTYEANISYAITLCPMIFHTAMNLSEIRALHASGEDAAASDASPPPAQPDEDWRGCIATGKTAAKKDLALALKAAKSAKAKDALRNIQVAFFTALDGISPGFEERKISYEQRQQALNDKLNEAMARFDVEN